MTAKDGGGGSHGVGGGAAASTGTSGGGASPEGKPPGPNSIITFKKEYIGMKFQEAVETKPGLCEWALKQKDNSIKFPNLLRFKQYLLSINFGVQGEGGGGGGSLGGDGDNIRNVRPRLSCSPPSKASSAHR